MVGDSGCCGSSQSPTQSDQPSTPQTTVSIPPADRHAIDDADDCCDIRPQPSRTSVDTCQAACCDTQVRTTPVQYSRPSCCEGRDLPCCDSSCIDRIALRECTSQETKSATSSACTRGESGKSCRYHNRRARTQYQFKLEALGCICRALLALGQESCCASSRQSLPQKKRLPSRTSVTTCAPADSCCAIKTTKVGDSAKIVCADARCIDGKSSISAGDEAGPCADACCAGSETNANQAVAEPTPDSTNAGHLETGVAGKEHIILSVSGMTCTGCETKLSRTLSTLPSLTKVKTSLVLSRVEFDLDSTVQSVAEIIKHLERTTEFKCERVTGQGSTIDLTCHKNPIKFVERDWSTLR